MNIIITMAGEGRRFSSKGFLKPKYELVAGGKTIFRRAMESLEDFYDCHFIFVGNLRFNLDFVSKQCAELGIKDYTVLTIHKTDGQAATALLAGSGLSKHEECVIYNIDTHIAPNTLCRALIPQCDGFIPVMGAEGTHWSFVDMDENGKVNKIVEKDRISDMASVGFYYFRSFELFESYYIRQRRDIKAQYGEVYVAPFYQAMVEDGLNIRAALISRDSVIALGTPAEVATAYPDFYSENNCVERTT